MDYIKAFVIGGAVCVLIQILMDKTKLLPVLFLEQSGYMNHFLNLPAAEPRFLFPDLVIISGRE